MKNSQLIFASNNAHKVEEVNAIIGNAFEVVGMQAAGIDFDIPEPHATIEANAAEKARAVFLHTNQNCFGDDTGLEVEALGGEPGVKSARYAGEGRDFAANVDKLLHKLQGVENRSARFKTVIALYWQGEPHFFEGIVNGTITLERRGTQGFGYDPVFIPEGSNKTFGEMHLAEKNTYSHRRRALDKMIAFLQQPSH